jgi:hypothetical protein
MTKFKSSRFKKGTKVHVVGDSSVGIPDWDGRVVKDYGDSVLVKDSYDGESEEVSKRFVQSEAELEERDEAEKKYYEEQQEEEQREREEEQERELKEEISDEEAISRGEAEARKREDEDEELE